MGLKGLVSMALLGFALAGCERAADWRAPAVPRGIYSINGDRQVDLYWEANSEPDLKGYNVYWAPGSSKGQGPFKRLGFTTRTHWADSDVQNGSTYYYGVTAVDQSGNESAITSESVHDTPRPEYFHFRLYNSGYEVSRGGPYDGSNALDLSSAQVISRALARADVFYFASGEHAYLYGQDLDTQIQDAGAASNLQDVDFSPRQGWVPSGRVELAPGHMLLVWTRDDHYAKILVRSFDNDHVDFDWAYQTDPGNRELKTIVPPPVAAGR